MPKTIYSKEYQVVIGKLKKARIAEGLRQAEVGKKLGLPQSFISKVERGERRLDIAELKKIAAVYRKPASFFID